MAEHLNYWNSGGAILTDADWIVKEKCDRFDDLKLDLFYPDIVRFDRMERVYLDWKTFCPSNYQSHLQ